MPVKLKALAEQVIVITGASSGIGLATAKAAARKGAKVVLSSRNEEALQQATEEIHGGRDYYVSAGGKLMTSLNKHLPGVVDWFAANIMSKQMVRGCNRS